MSPAKAARIAARERARDEAYRHGGEARYAVPFFSFPPMAICRAIEAPVRASEPIPNTLCLKCHQDTGSWYKARCPACARKHNEKAKAYYQRTKTGQRRDNKAAGGAFDAPAMAGQRKQT